MLHIFGVQIPWFIWLIPSTSLNSVMDSFMVRVSFWLYVAVESSITKLQVFSLQKWHIYVCYFLVRTKRCGGIAN